MDMTGWRIAYQYIRQAPSACANGACPAWLSGHHGYVTMSLGPGLSAVTGAPVSLMTG